MELKIILSSSDDHFFQPTTILAICKTQEGFPIYHKITSHKVKAFSMGSVVCGLLKSRHISSNFLHNWMILNMQYKKYMIICI